MMMLAVVQMLGVMRMLAVVQMLGVVTPMAHTDKNTIYPFSTNHAPVSSQSEHTGPVDLHH